MATVSVLRNNVDKAVSHYSSLFKLPTQKKILSLLFLSCLSTGVLFSLLSFSSLNGLIYGLFLGGALFLLNLFIDRITIIILRDDPIFDFRRTLALSFVCWIVWVFFVLLDVFFAILFGRSWRISFFLLGFSAVLILRLIVFFSTSNTKSLKLLVVAALHPFSCIVPLLLFLARIDYSTLLFLIFSLITGVVSTFYFVSTLNRIGRQTLGISSLSLFKAFLLNWIKNLNAPIEAFLEKLGEKRSVQVSLLKFSSQTSKACIVIPSVHPGPFRNVGSSLLPSTLKTVLEKQLNCIVCVPHGLFGHEYDLTSQQQNQKLINSVVKMMSFTAHAKGATPFFSVSNSLATACCQIFGNSAFLSFTLAPKTTEDLPHELGLFIEKEAEKYGLNCCIVNAHNSINGTLDLERSLDALKRLTVSCLKRVASEAQVPFYVGAATTVPKDFRLEDGMGPSGITVVVIKVSEQKAAYVVIDGNNMVSGLREKVLSALLAVGINAGEVFTTDTHAVNALILGQRGYHPVGEVIKHEVLIGHVKKLALTALSNLERVNAAYSIVTIPNITVVGSNLLDTVCVLIDKTLQRAKEILIPLFTIVGLVLMLFLFVF